MKVSDPLRRVVITALPFACLCFLAFGGPTESDPVTLRTGNTLVKTIAGAETHNYIVVLEAGQFAQVSVYQRGADIVLTVIDPHGAHLAAVDRPNGSWGPEDFSWIADIPGRYVIAVQSLITEAVAARYDIWIESLRNPTEDDRIRAKADRAYADAELRRNEDGEAEAFRRAIEKYEKAAELSHSIHDARRESIALTAIGELYVRLGERRLGVEYYDRALPLIRGVGEEGESASLLAAFGVGHFYAGDYQAALSSYKEALRTQELLGDRTGAANTLGNIGTAYRVLGELPRALDYLTRSLRLREAIGRDIGKGYVLTSIGLTYRSLGDYRKALESLNGALPFQRRETDKRGEGITLNAIGQVYESLGEKEKASQYYQQALVVLRVGGDRSMEAEVLRNLGAIYASSAERQRAIDAFNLSLTIQRSVGDRAGELRTLSEVAKAECDRGNLIEARKEAEAAVELAESLRTHSVSGDLHTAYLSQFSRAYTVLIDILMRLHRRDPGEGYDRLAFKASEAGRARTLLAMLREARAEIRLDADQKLINRERATLERLDALTEQQIRLNRRRHTPVEADVLARQIESVKGEYEDALTDLRRASPRFGFLSQPEILDIADIQRDILPPDTALIEYSIGDEISHVWWITREDYGSAGLPGRQQIDAAGRRVYELLTARNEDVKFENSDDRHTRIARADSELRNATRGLSEMLLAPAVAAMTAKRLLVVPDGILHYIPPAVLPSPVSSDAGALMGQVRQLVVLPSASVLRAIRRESSHRTQPARTVAVFADPVFDNTDSRVIGRRDRAFASAKLTDEAYDSPLARSAEDLGFRQGESLQLGRLPSTRNEARAIARLVPAAVRKEAFDFDANRQAAMSDDLSQYKFLHFATHGLLNASHPELSGLVLSLVDRDGADQEGFLSVLDVYRLRLPVELVVLSGCSTGLGKDVRGEGIVGLTRGFMYAGAARVLVSLWDVDDDATAALMARFYEGMLRRRLSPAAALRSAQVSIAKERRWQAPYYWGGFVLQGEPN
jgi:CHAT domain-containing protein/tetratricopeptide (TPR) repeat protein